MKKPSVNERIAKAVAACNEQQSNKKFEEKYEIVFCHVNDCLGIVAGLNGYKGEKIKYDIYKVDLSNDDKKREGECFFIQFTDDGSVVVVGAGYDYGLTNNNKYLNVQILTACDKKWREEAIIAYVNGIKPVIGRRGAGIADCEHILQCRNGIEMFLGEYLLSKKICILNEDSHKNYKKEFFEAELEKIKITL